MAQLFVIFRSELQRYFRSNWSSWGENLSWLLYTFLIFIAAIAILSGVRGGTLTNKDQLLVMVGWLAWIVASDCMGQLPDAISEEAQTGTLEQLCMSPFPLGLLLALRSLAYLFGAGIRGLVASLLFFLLIAPPPSVPALLLLFGISLVGAFGLGFIFAGLALVFKRVQALTDLVFSLMIFLTGALVGLENLGGWFIVLKLTFPLTWGISLMREVVQDIPLSVQWQSGEILGLILHSIVYLALGLGVFVWGYRRARSKGTLGHY